MTDPILWTGIVMLAGVLGAMAARAVGLPAASGALVAGFILSSVATGAGLVTARPDLRDLYSPLVALLCLLFGAELDLTALLRHLRSTVTTALIQGAMVGGLVWIAGMTLGLDGRSSLVLGVALTATCPAALIAVASESGSRGEVTQRLLALSSLSLLLALGTLHIAFLPGSLLKSFLVDLLIGGACGLVILVPLSRMAHRGAIVVAAMSGAVLLFLAVRPPPQPVEHLALMSIMAGFVATNLTPNRDAIRDALRDLSLPCLIILFALSGQGVAPHEIGPALQAGALLLAARSAGLIGASLVLRGRHDWLSQTLGQIPVAGLTSMGPVMFLFIEAVPGVEMSYRIPLAAVFLSEAAGMVGTRWALRRSGESVAPSENPDDWRARMR